MILSIKQVSKVYSLDGEEVHALNNVSFDVKKGELVSIIGPSGSGKSTLMHLIGLLDTPTSGQILLEGKDVSSASEAELAKLRNEHIGFIFQQFNLLPRTSALENVELPMYYGGISASERRERATKLLEIVGLGDRLSHFPNQLSGGQQQRVAVARALSMNPLIILADEPTGNLDSKTGADIMKLFHDLHEKGHTIIIVTHDSNIAKEAHREIHLKDGEILKDK